MAELKLLVDVRALGRKPSGVGIYLYGFLKELADFPDIEINLITDIAESVEIKELERRGAHIHKYGKVVEKSMGVYAYFRYIQKIISGIKPDIFWEGNNLIPVRLKNPYGKIIVTIHDVFPITVPQGYGKVYQYYFRVNLRKTLRNTDAIVYNSVETRKETESIMAQAKSKNNFVSYVVVEEMPKTKISDKGYFLYIGNLEKRKGTDILLLAYREYRRIGGTKRLILAGKMREKEIAELYEKISSETDGLAYVGYVEAAKKDQLLAACSCFIFPSRAEGFGIPVIEAFYYQKPVIGSQLSIFREITDGQIQSFILDASVNKTAGRLAEEMLHIQYIDVQNLRRCANRYGGKILVRALKDYFDEIVRKR
ncbi:MAG: glycosyltransferase [Roseburia sp.]